MRCNISSISGRDYSIFINPHKYISDYGDDDDLPRRAADSEYVFSSERGLGMKNFLRPGNPVSSLIDLAVTDPGCFYAEVRDFLWSESFKS